MDEQRLKQENIATDTASLLAFLRDRARCDIDLQRLEQLLNQLRSQGFREREEASKKLPQIGLRAVPGLRRALKDREGAYAAYECEELEWMR